MENKQIPVYLFTGFLEAGKTQMIQESLENPTFNDGCRILLLVCEEGIEEYDPSLFFGQNVHRMVVEKESDLTLDLLADYNRNHRIDRVMVEYNGMWPLETLYAALPHNWMVYQQLMFVDARTALLYNANMRQLMVDKLQNADTVIFNRAENADRDALHKLVRGISRMAQIAYEVGDELEYDETVDPLPFDVDAPIVTIEDKDYAFFYRDLSDSMPDWDGKTVKFKGLIARNRELGDKAIVIGRHIMTCCEDDIAFGGLVCNFKTPVSYQTGEWLVVTAKLRIERHKLYGSEGPVLYATDVARSSEPKNTVVTFY